MMPYDWCGSWSRWLVVGEHYVASSESVRHSGSVVRACFSPSIGAVPGRHYVPSFGFDTRAIGALKTPGHRGRSSIASAPTGLA